ncbi:hypothetical protein JZ785_18765 [Alicyclobacillus curvatus]|nr:hypothetical protein JZ785_18765 [Alicyclobacillus curvatus]
MTNKDRILSALSHASLCDDCLSAVSGVEPRQQVYSICTGLHANKLIHRHHGKCDHCRKAKLTNSMLNNQRPHDEVAVAALPSITPTKDSRPWYWEGNVQARVVSYLAKTRYAIRSVSDTASREAGKDIVAVGPDGHELWVSVKGYPESSGNVRARQWFSAAIFDLLLYRGQDPKARLAMALPAGFVTYSNLLPRIVWLKQDMQFQVFWVSEDGSVGVE